MTRDPYKYFRIEARELLDQLNQAVLELEKESTPARVAKLLRLAHTLKGAARVVKRTDIGDLAHAIEDTLEPLRGLETQAPRPVIDTVLGYLDDINNRVTSLGAQTAEQPQAPASAPVTPAALAVSPAAAPGVPTIPQLAPSEDFLRTVRVDVGEMDTLLDGFAEVHAQLQSLRESLRQTADIGSQLELLGGLLAAQGDPGSTTGNRRAQYGLARAAVEGISASIDRLNRGLTSSIEQFDRELTQVRDAAERMRLIRASTLFGALERVARDAAQMRSKKIVLEAHGGEVRLDAQVLGAVQDALSHVVRNAVVHGIEAPADRQLAGKPVEGRVMIDVTQQGRWIAFTCADDGRGIDLSAVRRVAEAKGLLPPEAAQAAGSDTLVQLLLKGGISTSETVSELAGRGVGLDVVRDAAERLQGKVELRTEAGRGTSLTLTVPLLISSLDGLLVEAAGVIVTIPIEAVRRTLRLAPSEIARTAQGETILFDGRAIPYLPLQTVLSIKAPAGRSGKSGSAVVVETASGAAAIGVDKLHGVTNVVLRPLPALALAKPIISGVSLNLEGNPQLVLDPVQLVLAAQGSDVPLAEPELPHHTILVIDDSLTTRMLERSILESAGYNVDVAVSAEEGLEKALQSRYALFLVDVEMPGMDGFSFIERTQSTPQLRDIPAILVTSRASPEDLQRGKDVGARGYLIKSEFDQGVLLARIGELVR